MPDTDRNENILITSDIVTTRTEGETALLMRRFLVRADAIRTPGSSSSFPLPRDDSVLKRLSDRHKVNILIILYEDHG